MNLRDRFDVVVMLTWSDWRTEPRSNRYHYATRFARTLPVLFVQVNGSDANRLVIEASGADRIDIVRANSPISSAQVDDFCRLLQARGFHRPLLWLYNPVDYLPLMERLGSRFTVLHATEDYFTETEAAAGLESSRISEALRQLRKSVDLLVCVSEGVARSFRQSGKFECTSIVAANGCDTGQIESALVGVPRPSQHAPVAIYQGGINRRLDFVLLHRLIHLLPDWSFLFCGKVEPGISEWELIASHPNVRYAGSADAEEVARLMGSATVGLIPYQQSAWIRNSLPLKAYEYVAAGLPVVSVPVDSLRVRPDLFAIADDAEGFADAMRRGVASRSDESALRVRRVAAAEASYDRRFESVMKALEERCNILSGQSPRLNVALLYDERWTHVGTIEEHVEAFRKYSRHNFYFIPGTVTSLSDPPLHWSVLADQVDLSVFDVVIVHYSVRISLSAYINEGLAERIARYTGLKILFIQDEYETTEVARSWMDRLGMDVVYTCVPARYREQIYPSHRYPGTEFLPTLTGYVPEKPGIESYAVPLRERNVRIAYRGRVLHPVYGNLAREKYRIGVDMRALASKRGVDVDIEVDDAKRIYGDDWYRFLGRARATLGTESGSNVFDFHGDLRARIDVLLARSPDTPYESIHRQILHGREDLVKMNQISPKIFEAIRLGTALVLFEGEYSGVVQKDQHYIPLAKDYSNVDQVFARLEDLDYLEGLTERAYRDVIGSGRYSYRHFIEGIDAAIDARVLKGPRYRLLATPTFAMDSEGKMKYLIPTHPIGFSICNQMLGGSVQREQIAALAANRGAPGIADSPVPRGTADSVVVARQAWRLVPRSMRNYIVALMRRWWVAAQQPALHKGFMYFAWRTVWRCLPTRLRGAVVERIRAG